METNENIVFCIRKKNSDTLLYWRMKKLSMTKILSATFHRRQKYIGWTSLATKVYWKFFIDDKILSSILHWKQKSMEKIYWRQKSIGDKNLLGQKSIDEKKYICDSSLLTFYWQQKVIEDIHWWQKSIENKNSICDSSL